MNNNKLNFDSAQTVLDEIGELLPEEDRSVSSLLKIVNGNLAGRSDLIEIVATHGNPVLAAEIANAWSSAYVDQVNAVYSGGETPDAYRAIQSQTIEARETYDKA